MASFFSRIFSTIKNFIIPSVKKIAASDVGKSLGKAAATSVSSFGGDILAGKNPKEAGKESLNKGIQDLQKSVTRLVERKIKKVKKGKKKSNIKGRKKGFQFFDP